MNKTLEKITDALNSDVAEIFFAMGEFSFLLAGTVAGIFELLTTPFSAWWLFALAICIYAGVRALENLLYVGIDDDKVAFGEEIYIEEED